jgi:ubiquinone/menaquinone biosynthesis C-methylase UbiE
MLAAWAIAAALAAQAMPAHPDFRPADRAGDGLAGADWLERSEREQEESPDVAVRLLQIPQGASVADIGAGSGYITLLLSAAVGPTGRVFANDLQPQMIEILRRRLASQNVTNVTLVQGSVDDPNLPPASVDLALMVDVYHELSRPQAMLQKLRSALKPGGRLALVEYRKEDPAIPIKFEHKMSIQEAKAELEAEGFKLSKVDESLPRQHILIFTVAVH